MGQTPNWESCKNILHVHCKTPNNACRAELRTYLLNIQILKRSVKFYNHLKGSDVHTFHHKALTYSDINLEKSPLGQLVLDLCSHTDPTEPQDSNTIRPKQIMRKQKDNYLTHWRESTKKPSKLECYLALNKENPLLCTDPMSIALLLREVAIGRLGSWERKAMCTLLTKWRGLRCTSIPPVKVMTILETHISHRYHKPIKNLKTNQTLINSHNC